MTRTLLALFLAVAALEAQTITLTRPNGSNITVTVSSEPNGVDSVNVTWLKDPDGDGPLKSPRAVMTDTTWAALMGMLTKSYGEKNSADHEAAALAYYADHNVSYSAGSGDHRNCTLAQLNDNTNKPDDCVKWHLYRLFAGWDDYMPKAGSCWIPGTSSCGYTSANSSVTDYTSDHVRDWGFAFSVAAPLLSPAELDKTIPLLIGGIAAPDPGQTSCDNRIPDRPLAGSYTWTYTPGSNQCGTTVTGQWTGTALDPALVGKWVWAMPAWSDPVNFTAATSVVVPWPGRTPSAYACWTTAGARLTGTAAYAPGQATITFPVNTGTCRAFEVMTGANGYFVRVTAIGPYSGGTQTVTLQGYCEQSTGTSANKRNVIMPLKDPNPNSCGIGWISGWHGSAVEYQSYEFDETELVGNITPTQTTITTAMVTGTPGVPFYIGITTGVGEVMKVTAVAGAVWTVERGSMNTVAQAWEDEDYIHLLHADNASTDGIDNRSKTKHDGHWSMAFAAAPYSAIARDFTIPRLNTFWYNNTYTRQFPWMGSFLETSLTSYGLSRSAYHYSNIVQNIFSKSGGAVNYREDWAKTTYADRYYWNAWPWAPRVHHYIHGQQNSCKYLDGGGTQCYAPLLMTNHWYRGSDETRKGLFLAIEDNNLLSTANQSAGGIRAVGSMLMYYRGDETTLDYKLGPTHKITGPVLGDSKNYNVAVSRQSWAEASDYVAFISLDSEAGDKFTGGAPNGLLIAAKERDVFIGNDCIGVIAFGWQRPQDCGQGDYGESRRSTVMTYNDLGYRQDGALPQNVEWPETYGDSTLMSIRNYQQPGTGINTGLLGFDLLHKHRHLTHFKATSRIVVYDDVAVTGISSILGATPYNNNTQTFNPGNGTKTEGRTTLAATGLTVTSRSYTGNHILTSTAVIWGDYTSDLNLSRAGQVISVGVGCTSSDPCYLKTPSGVFAYTSTPTVTIPATAARRWFIWADPTDGSLHAAPFTGGSAATCTAGITCETVPIANWPSSAVRLYHVVNSNSGVPNGCPGNSWSTNYMRDWHCGSTQIKRFFTGYIANRFDGQFLVVHQIHPTATAPSSVTRLATIDSNHVGVEIGGTNPSVAVYPKGKDQYGSVSFTTTHTGTARVVVNGLPAGTYQAKRNGVNIGSPVIVTAGVHTLAFDAASGAITVTTSTLRYIYTTGQSLSRGRNGSPVVNSTAPFTPSNVKLWPKWFGAGIDTATFVNLISDEPLTRGGGTTNYEDPGQGMANTLRQLQGGNSSPRILVDMHGVGGRCYANLKRGAFTTDLYASGTPQVWPLDDAVGNAFGVPPRPGNPTTMGRSLALANAAGDILSITAMTVVHGECNLDTDTSEATYKSNLVEWRANFNQEASAVMGTTVSVPLFTSQIHTWAGAYNRTQPTTSTGSSESTPMAQWTAARDNPTAIGLVTPHYFLPHGSDELHMSASSYERLGGYFAKAINKWINEGKIWRPISPRSISYAGSTITARFHVPVMPLVFDTVQVTNPGDYGFEVWRGATRLTLTGVSLAGDIVTVVVAGGALDGSERLRYAYTSDCTGDGCMGPATGPRGNLRDNDGTQLQRLAQQLHNWCITFNEPINGYIWEPDGGAAPPTLAIAPTAITEMANEDVVFAASGGLPPYTWTAPGGVPASGSGVSFTTRFASPGIYTITLTDAVLTTAASTATITPGFSISPTSMTVAIGANVQILASGGIPPYSWGAPGSTNPSATANPFITTYTASGSYVITGNDSQGNTMTADITVTAGGPPSEGGGTKLRGRGAISGRAVIK